MMLYCSAFSYPEEQFLGEWELPVLPLVGEVVQDVEERWYRIVHRVFFANPKRTSVLLYVEPAACPGARSLALRSARG